MMKFFQLAVGAVVFVCGLWFLQLIYLSPAHQKKQTVTVPKNASAKSISYLLAEKNITSHPKLFYAYLRLNNIAKKLKPGEYEFKERESFQKLKDALLKGSVKLYSVTITEGLNSYEIADILERNQIVSKKDFLDAVFDPDLCKIFSIPGQSFEGFLFPDTYLFEKNTPVNKVLHTMHDQFKLNLPIPDQVKAKRLGLSLLEWITLASIIEKESSNIPEQPIISSVFHNRLKLNMPLQTDPTVIYGIKGFDGNLTRKHLKTLTPYNTYMIKGLPPGPIANPGLTAIKAAVNPAKTDYLYFVAMGNQNQHYFSKTYQQHLHAVKYYQLKKGAPPPQNNL
ncbi:MAG TPA: endolytic transglycosylase MltG [Oligoflexia bacterium]|nr:endolytic transglycosylase MltG [Oligoflexia bacterium]HMR24486.1 endolytic transglycosylase MltG [Oligoflexia bacterium]